MSENIQPIFLWLYDPLVATSLLLPGNKISVLPKSILHECSMSLSILSRCFFVFSTSTTILWLPYFAWINFYVSLLFSKIFIWSSYCLASSYNQSVPTYFLPKFFEQDKTSAQLIFPILLPTEPLPMLLYTIEKRSEGWGSWVKHKFSQSR